MKKILRFTMIAAAAGPVLTYGIESQAALTARSRPRACCSSWALASSASAGSARKPTVTRDA